MDDIGAKRLHDQRPPDQTAGTSKTDSSKPWGLLILLMAMTAIGPTTLNILVPALPQLSWRLDVSISVIQLTVSIYLLALAAGQLLTGPLSDRFGRRPVLFVGLALTAAASILAIVVPNVGGLIGARILQAIGASAGIVIGRAIIRDLFDRSRAAAMMGLVATVMVVLPTLGPLIGGLLDTAFGWESIFICTALSSLAVLAWAAMTLPETRGLNTPAGMPQGFLRDFVWLARNRNFAGYVLAAALGSATFFAFLGGGPYVVITLMDRTSAEYGVWFAISSIGYMAGNYIASRMSTQLGIDRLIWWGIAVEAVGVVAATLLAMFAHHLGPAIVFMPQLVVSLGNGLMLPGALTGAVSVRPQAAGTAAGIAGFAQMGVGAAMTQYAGTLLADASSAVPMALLMNVIVLVLAVSFGLLVRRH